MFGWLPLRPFDEKIDGSDRPNDAEARQENVPEKGLATIDDNLVARADSNRGLVSYRPEQVNQELALPPVWFPSQDPNVVPPAELVGATRLGHRFGNRGFRPHRKHLRPTYLTRDRYADERLHHELRILFKPRQKGANVLLGC